MMKNPENGMLMPECQRTGRTLENARELRATGMLENVRMLAGELGEHQFTGRMPEYCPCLAVLPKFSCLLPHSCQLIDSPFSGINLRH